MINKNTSKKELERLFFENINKYFASFDREVPLGMISQRIDKDSYEGAIICHNELVRRSNEEFAQWSKRAWEASNKSTKASIRLTRFSMILSFTAAVFAGVAVWYNQLDMTSDEVWQNRQLELLDHIKDNTQTAKILQQENESLQRENDSLKNELYKVEMLLQVYEK